MDALGDLHLLAGVPAGPIEDQQDPPGRSSPDVSGEGGQHLPKERGRDGRQEPPFRLTGGGTDEATDIQPLVALLHRSDRPLPDGSPDLPNEWEQANPMLVRGPELDLGIRMCCVDLRYPFGELC